VYLTLDFGSQQQRTSSACCSIQNPRAALQLSKRLRIRGSQASRRQQYATYPACARTLTGAHTCAAQSARREPRRASQITRVQTIIMAGAMRKVGRSRGVRRRVLTSRDDHNQSDSKSTTGSSSSTCRHHRRKISRRDKVWRDSGLAPTGTSRSSLSSPMLVSEAINKVKSSAEAEKEGDAPGAQTNPAAFQPREMGE